MNKVMLNLPPTIRNYKLINQLKGGAQGLVYVVESVLTQEKYVLKSMCMEESNRPSFEKTMEIWKLVCESEVKNYFVKYKEHFYEGTNAILIMEYCAAGDLDSLIKKKFLNGENFSEMEIMKMLVEAVSALQKLHSLNMIHRDVKAANFLIGNDGKLKICDFNTSKVLEEMKGASTMVGTLEYSAPEVVSSENYTCSVDMWSFGTVLYQIMVGKTPFANERGVNLVKLAQGKYEPIGTSLGYSPPLVNLVNACLAVNPTDRPTAEAVLDLPFVIRAAVRAEFREALAAQRKEVEEVWRQAEQREKKLREELEEEKRETALLKEKMAVLAEVEKGGCCDLKFVLSPQPSLSGVVYSGTRIGFDDGTLSPRKGFRPRRTIALVTHDYSIKKNKVFLLDVTVKGDVNVGVAMKSTFPAFYTAHPCEIGGNCMIFPSGISTGGTYPVSSASMFWDGSGPNAVHVRLELDMSEHTLHFFINNVQVLHFIKDVPTDVYFAVFDGGANASSCWADVRSFRSTSSSTTTKFMCTPHPWKN